MTAKKKCVKCEFHGEKEFYTGGHGRRCRYRHCECEDCVEHDQLLALNRRESGKRKRIKDHSVLSRGKGKGKKLKHLVEVRRGKAEGLNNNLHSICSKNADEELIVLSSDTEGFLTDVDDRYGLNDDSTDDELPDPEVRTSKQPSPTDKRHSIFSSDPGHIVTPRLVQTHSASPGSLRTNITPVKSVTPVHPGLCRQSRSTTPPPAWTLSSHPAVQPSLPPVVVHLSSDSDTDQEEEEVWEGRKELNEGSRALRTDEGTEEIEMVPLTFKMKVKKVLERNARKYSSGVEAAGDLTIFQEDFWDFPKICPISSTEEELNDMTVDDEEKSNEVDITKSEKLGEVAEDMNPIEPFDGGNEQRFIGKCSEQQPVPRRRPSRWDVPPPLPSGPLPLLLEVPLPLFQGPPPPLLHFPPPGWTRPLPSCPPRPGCQVPPPHPSFTPPPVLHLVKIPIPTHLVGLLLGKGCHFIHRVRMMSGAAVSLGPAPVFCTIEGSRSGVAEARRMIKERLGMIR
eukprot:GFUD01026132.1.p1 GENE.GFUD01026132.1~~GFUD01026132.1.p1  ORF type:complete len:510 (-),score=159.20 GFUD01026132.1:61-1590(-)